MFKSDLSERMYRILCFIADYKRAHSYAPSIREIGAAISVDSTSLVDYYLKQLEEDGYITRDSRIARTVNLTAKARAIVNPARAE